MDGHPALVGIERRTFRDRPGHEHTTDLQPEVVVEPRGAVALDHEPTAPDREVRFGPRVYGRRRLRGLGEVALAAVFVEWHQTISVPAGDASLGLVGPALVVLAVAVVVAAAVMRACRGRRACLRGSSPGTAVVVVGRPAKHGITFIGGSL